MISKKNQGVAGDGAGGLDPGSEALLERLRRLGLGVAQGDSSAPRVAIVVALSGRVRARLLEAFGRGVEEDGGRVVAARVGRDPYAAPRALVRGLGARADRGGAAALARAALEGAASASSWTAVVLDGADDAPAETARWFWAVARRLAGDSLAPTLLVAVVAPTRVAAAVSPWRALEAALAGSLRVTRLSTTGAGEHDLGGHGATAADEEMRRTQRARRREGSAWIARVSRLRRGRAIPDAEDGTARHGALAAALAALRGDIPAGAAAADAAAAAAADADDLHEDAAAELAAACAALTAESSDAEARARTAEIAARLAGDAACTAGARLAAACALAARGEDLAAREALAGVARRPLARPLRAMAGALHGWLRGEQATAPRGDRADAWGALADAARAEAPADDARRARAASLFAATGARATMRAWATARAEGLAVAARADTTATIAALAPIAGADTVAALASASLDALLALVPARGGRLLVGQGLDALPAARRGASFFGLPAAARLALPLRTGPAADPLGSLVLERSEGDPPFSRDERRLGESVAALVAARLAALTTADATREGDAPAPRAKPARRELLGLAEKEVLLRALAANGKNLSRTARALGLSRNGLKLKLARHGLR